LTNEAFTEFCRLFLTILPNEREVKTMELVEKQTSSSPQSWTDKVERRRSPKVDFSFELRCWLQRAILEAEKGKDLNRKRQLLGLLREL
jgi:hypothetical protein